MRFLVLVLVVLAVVYMVATLGERRGARPVPLFPAYKPERAAGIYIKAGERRVALERTPDGWIVPSEDSLPADPRGVDSILDKVAAFSLKDRVSSNPDKRSVYQVDSSGVFVWIVDESGDTTAAFVVGKVGPDYQSSYVREAWGDDVILTPGYLRSMFDRGEMTWQDRLIFDYSPDEITSISVRRGGEEYTLASTDGAEWYFAAPESAACNRSRAARLARLLAHLRCEDFAGRLPLPEAGIAGSDTALSFSTAGGLEHRLVFGSENDDRRVHFTKDDSDVVYLLARSKVDRLLPPRSEMLPEETEAAE